jgi:hypothetical protein
MDPRTIMEEVLKVMRDLTIAIYTDAFIKDKNLEVIVIILDINDIIYKVK